MNYTIQTERLRVEISSIGAELQSIINAEGKELLWQGNPRYWNRRSPLLFPFPGKSWNDTITIEGIGYPMPKHGFVSDMEFQVTDQQETMLEFLLTDTPETLKAYPYHFELRVLYTIVGSSLNVTWRVKNTNDQFMYFMIGAHPAFNLPQYDENDKIHGYLYTADAPSFTSNVVLPDGYCHPETNTVMLHDGLLPITNHTFACDTILDQTGQFRKITLINKHRNPVLRMCFNAPVIAMWAPCDGNCPFVCIEPWNGICDSFEKPVELKDRNLVNSITPCGEWTNTYTITAL